jgi:hypothetical protein
MWEEGHWVGRELGFCCDAAGDLAGGYGRKDFVLPPLRRKEVVL